jgi:phage repressor protein C with HTH and peptisase S24 domain
MSDLVTGNDLKLAIRGKGLTVEEAAKALGVSRQTMFNYYSRPELDDDFLLKVKNVLNVQLGQAAPYLEQRRAQKTISKQFMVPLVPVKAQAGYVKAVDQEAYLNTLEEFALPPGVNPQGAIWRYWEIEGRSMEPEYKDGDVLLTSQVHHYDWDNLRNFYAYVIVTTENVLFKRIYCKNPLEWVLISENEDEFPQQLLPVEYIKEVWVVRRVIKNKMPPNKVFEIKV